MPFLCIHGADDLIALPKSTDYVFEHAGTPLALRQKHIIAGAKHEPFHEIESIRTAAIAYVVQYFETQYLNKDLVVVEESSLVVADTTDGAVGATASATTGESSDATADVSVGVELTQVTLE